MLHTIGHAVDDLFANPGDGQGQEEHARKKDDGKRGTPGNVHRHANRISEVGVQRHAGRQGDGIVSIQTHHESGYRCREACSKDHALSGHSGLREDLRIDHDDIRHGHKSRQAAQHLLL